MKYQCPKCKSANVSFEICTHSMVAPNVGEDYHRQILDGDHEVMTAFCDDCEHEELTPNADDTWTEEE